MYKAIAAFLISIALPLYAWAEEPLLAKNGINDQAAVVNINNDFAFKLYDQLKGQPGNLFFSPESISMALAMVYAGARGNTAIEMSDTLHFGMTPEQLHSAMGAQLHDLNAPHSSYSLNVANALWVQNDYNLLPEFMKVTKDNYGAAVFGVDFKNADETARQTINTWVEQQTANKITNLISPGVLAAHTRLVLTNAIYFKGDWQAKFKKEETKDEDFYLSAAQTVKVPLMHQTGQFNYFEDRTFQVLELPYKDKELSMLVFLPKTADGLPALEQIMPLKNMRQCINEPQPCYIPLRLANKVIVTMPKFRMEAQFQLNHALEALGIKQAFDGNKADFSGMVSRETMQRDGNLYISDVLHKAYIDVNEEGTEAAAATAVVMSHTRRVHMEPPPVIFRADHPFLLMIRDNRSGSVLFMGRVTNPLH